MVYVALLRGINVGGNNKVGMKELKAAFEAAGMTSVRTYINSGNVIFTSKSRDREALTRLLGKAISERFGFEVNLLVRDIDQIRSVIDVLPEHWANDQTMKCDVIFLWDDIDEASVLDQLSFRPEMEDVIYTPGAVIWRIDRENATRSGLPRIVGTPLYKRMTVRNCNTARKLLALMEA